MTKPHTKGCNDENICQACQDVARYVGWVKELGITEAQAMMKEINKNKKNMEKQLEK